MRQSWMRSACLRASSPIPSNWRNKSTPTPPLHSAPDDYDDFHDYDDNNDFHDYDDICGDFVMKMRPRGLEDYHADDGDDDGAN